MEPETQAPGIFGGLAKKPVQQPVQEPVTQQPQIDKRAVAMARAIRQQESQHNYNAVGDGGTSHGAYQFHGNNFQTWAKEAGKDPNDFSPRNQDEVAYHKIKTWIDNGFTPAQVAAAWNAGEGSAKSGTWQNKVAYDNTGNELYNTPKYVSSVLNNLRQVSQQMGAGQQNVGPSGIEAQKQFLREQGQPVSLKENRAEPTFAGKLIRGALKTPASLLTNVVGIGQTLMGAKAEDIKSPFSGDYLGEVKPIGVANGGGLSAENLKQSVGAGLELASYIPAGGAVKGLATGGKGVLGQALRTGAEGAFGGALAGTGQGLQENKSVMGALGQGAIGAGVGGLTGGVLGAAVPVISSVTKGVGKLAKASGILETTGEDVAKATQDVAKEYERAAGTGLPNSFRRKQATRTGELKPWSQTLAEYGIVPEEGIDKSWDVEKALSDIDALNDEFGKTKQNFIKNENTLFNVDDALSTAFTRIDDSLKSEVARKQAKNRLIKEVDAILGKNVQRDVSGKRIVDAKTLERLRDVGYEMTPFNASDPQRIGQSTGYALAKAVNEQIEKQGTFPAYKAFNKEWSNILNAQEALNQLSTKKVRLSKGLSGQIAMKALGPIFGYSKGGIMGAILGDLGAETAGRLLSDPQLRTIISRSVIKYSGQKMPKEAIIANLEKEIADYVAKTKTFPQLPSAGQSSAPMFTPSPTTYEARAKQINRQPQPETKLLPAGNKGLIQGEPIRLPVSARETNLGLNEVKKATIVNPSDRRKLIQKGLLKKAEGETPPTKKIPTNRGFISTGSVFKNEGDLTTKILKDLEGKTTVSKQYILDATNRGELKQVERDLTRQILDTMPDEQINVKDFANKVKAELLPLKVSSKNSRLSKDPNADEYFANPNKYENITLPNELRGNVKNYKENIYESPIKTSAGQTHFNGQSDNYFGHTRIEDMADNKTRRVIEVQSDLYQKGNLEREFNSVKDIQKQADPHFEINGNKITENTELKVGQFIKDPNQKYNQWKIKSLDYESDPNYVIGKLEKYDTEVKPRLIKYGEIDGAVIAKKKPSIDKIMTQAEKRNLEVKKLQQYNDPTAHFRMIREEIKKASQDGKTKLQFPTGETAMKIEGLGEDIANNPWRSASLDRHLTDPDGVKYSSMNKPLSEMKDDLYVGMPVKRAGDNWIITDVLGDGKFKAVPITSLDDVEMKLVKAGKLDEAQAYRSKETPEFNNLANMQETFDISGKVDTNNPIYKFYEKDVAKYLNKFGGKKVVDDKGVSWIEIPITKEQGKAPVEAFGKAMLSPINIGAGLGLIGTAVGANIKQKKTPLLKQKDTTRTPTMPR